MRWFSLLVISFVVTRPAPVLAQTVKPADLVGEWARSGEKTPALTLRVDSTFVWLGMVPAQYGGDVEGRWRLRGDTLTTYQAAATAKMGENRVLKINVPETNNLVKLQGKVLTLTGLIDSKVLVFDHLNSPKPKP